jgi:hypothetical protein
MIEPEGTDALSIPLEEVDNVFEPEIAPVTPKVPLKETLEENAEAPVIVPEPLIVIGIRNSLNDSPS